MVEEMTEAFLNGTPNFGFRKSIVQYCSLKIIPFGLVIIEPGKFHFNFPGRLLLSSIELDVEGITNFGNKLFIKVVGSRRGKIIDSGLSSSGPD